MQIHEITNPQINEGLLDLAKRAAGGVKGAIQGYQQSKTDRRTSQAGAVAAKKALSVWNQYTKQLKAANPDPQRYLALYRQALAAFVQKNLLNNQSIDSQINQQELNQLINAVATVKDNPQQMATLFGQLVTQSALAQPDITRGSQVMAKIVSTNPTVIQYRNINYAQNQQGDWANQTTGRVPDESFQAFLDQEAARAGA